MLHADLAYPSWQDPIANLFAQPYWIAPARRTEVSQQWLGCMQGYDVRLDDYGSVKNWSVQIYQYLHSREMPLTDDPTQAWPDEALETFRIWVNQDGGAPLTIRSRRWTGFRSRSRARSSCACAAT